MSPEDISCLSNLCITKRFLNSRKGYKFTNEPI